MTVVNNKETSNLDDIKYQDEMTDWAGFQFTEGDAVYIVRRSSGHDWECEVFSNRDVVFGSKDPIAVVTLTHLEILPHYVKRLHARLESIEADLRAANETLKEMEEEVEQARENKDLNESLLREEEYRDDFLFAHDIEDYYSSWARASIDKTLTVKNAIKEVLK